MSTSYTQRTFTERQGTKETKKKLEDQEKAKPGAYSSPWTPKLDTAADQILNREAFQYDLNTDPLYQQYRDNYVNQGRRAMEDTLGRSAALTGGYGNSHAQLAGQQAYMTQLQNLNNVIPELYQLALDTYDRRGQDLLSRYGVAEQREGTDYSRYRDGLDSWADYRDYLAGRYDAERGFDYSEFRDQVSDDQWKAAFDEDIRRFDFENGLGEFAPVPGSGGTEVVYVGKPRDQEDEEDPEESPASKPVKYPLADFRRPIYAQHKY